MKNQEQRGQIYHNTSDAFFDKHLQVSDAIHPLQHTRTCSPQSTVDLPADVHRPSQSATNQSISECHLEGLGDLGNSPLLHGALGLEV